MTISKTINPVRNYTLVLQFQAEYSVAAKTVTLRCRLEMPATGQHCGFNDLDSLLAAIEAEVLAMQQRLLVAGQEQS